MLYFHWNFPEIRSRCRRDNRTQFIVIMLRSETDDKPLFEQIMTDFADAYRRHSARMI